MIIQLPYPNLTDSELLDQFAQCTLDPSPFNHLAHLRLGWAAIQAYGLKRAKQVLSVQIAAFDKIHGDGTKYHETVTIASLEILNHFMKRVSSTSFPDFIREFPRLHTHFKALVAQHYSFDIFGHPDGRKQYLKPDLLPF